MEATLPTNPVLNSPPPPRHGRRRVAALRFALFGVLVTLCISAIETVTLFGGREHVEHFHFDETPTGELHSGSPRSAISAMLTSKIETVRILGQPVATYIHSRVAWNPARPEEQAIRASIEGLTLHQSPQLAALWRSTNLVERLAQPPIGPYRSFRVESGVWTVPVLGAGIAGLLYSSFRWGRRRVLAAQHRSRIAAGLCGVCGFDRRGSAIGTPCPECGRVP